MLTSQALIVTAPEPKKAVKVKIDDNELIDVTPDFNVNKTVRLMLSFEDQSLVLEVKDRVVEPVTPLPKNWNISKTSDNYILMVTAPGLLTMEYRHLP